MFSQRCLVGSHPRGMFFWTMMSEAFLYASEISFTFQSFELLRSLRNLLFFFNMCCIGVAPSLVGICLYLIICPGCSVLELPWGSRHYQSTECFMGACQTAPPVGFLDRLKKNDTQLPGTSKLPQVSCKVDFELSGIDPHIADENIDHKSRGQKGNLRKKSPLPFLPRCCLFLKEEK